MQLSQALVTLICLLGEVSKCFFHYHVYYTPIAFDERVTFWLQRAGSCTALCVCALLHCMRMRLRNGYTQAYAQIMQHIHTHKAVTGRVEGIHHYLRP